MSVVINELEVVVSPPDSPAPDRPPPQTAPPLAPPELNAFLERRVRQELRTFAH
jgi:hypothetical protein